MQMRSRYNTKQKNEILTYLQKIKGTPVSAVEISDHLEQQGAKVGKATIYRQLERLQDEGLITKYTADGDRSAYYEYIGKADCVAAVCYHCKCLRCGDLIHLDCGELAAVNAHLAAEHGFTVDPVKTIIYGLSSRCREEE